jgi:hypothetical protein
MAHGVTQIDFARLGYRRTMEKGNLLFQWWLLEENGIPPGIWDVAIISGTYGTTQLIINVISDHSPCVARPKSC